MPTPEADANKSKKATINLILSDTWWFDEKNISTEVYPLIQICTYLMKHCGHMVHNKALTEVTRSPWILAIRSESHCQWPFVHCHYLPHYFAQNHHVISTSKLDDLTSFLTSVEAVEAVLDLDYYQNAVSSSIQHNPNYLRNLYDLWRF